MAEANPTVTIVDFYAPWCGPCKAMEPIYEELEKELAGKVKFDKVNVDVEGERSNSAGVLSIPTTHIIKEGKIIDTMIGFQSKDELTKRLNSALAS